MSMQLDIFKAAIASRRSPALEGPMLGRRASCCVAVAPPPVPIASPIDIVRRAAPKVREPREEALLQHLLEQTWLPET
eukprot:15480936-Alexandrium_andersonii.AAC.1